MTFGRYVRQRRLALGKEQMDLPGFHDSYMSMIETGKSNPRKPDTIRVIADFLEITDWQWLWVYSLLDDDPTEVFGKPRSDDPSVAAVVRRLEQYNNSLRQVACDACDAALNLMDRLQGGLRAKT